MARKMMLAEHWIQSKGQLLEHFDLTSNMRILAIRSGAKEITHRDMARIWEKKRGALSSGRKAESRG
jgi:hypothetical protein